MRKLLRVNLSNKVIKEEKIPDQICLEYVGGRGFGARYLYDEVPPGTEPLSPSNKLIFSTGPLAGTSAQCLSKWLVATKSPLTRSYTRSYGGGDFGAWLKWSGFELMIIEGKADKPSYIHIKDDKCEIKDASALWEKKVGETQDLLKKEYGTKARIICVGPAAENKVLYAAIFTGHRAAGRGGVGTVMASKNLKAIVIEATRKDDIVNPQKFKELVKKQVEESKEKIGYGPFKDYGTVMGVDIPGTSHGCFPVKNFREADFEGFSNLSFVNWMPLVQKHNGCYACSLKCGKVRTVLDGPYAGTTTEGPHYETLWAFAGSTACSDIGAITRADQLCWEYGMDSISCGNSIGFAYELFEKGILTTKDTDGLALTYSDPEPMLKLIEKIGNREGIGDILADGVKRAAERIGKGSYQYAMHVKGLELPGYEPRALKTLGMSYALSNVGGHHKIGYAGQDIGNPTPREVDPAGDEGKGDIIKYNFDYTVAVELVNCCSFATANLELFDLSLIAEMLVAALGEEKFGSTDYLWFVAEKVYNLERCFNIREGFSRKDDALPKRMYAEPLKGGVRDGEIIRKPDTIIDEFYHEMGWDKNGIPTKETLTRLGLQDIEKDIAKCRK